MGSDGFCPRGGRGGSAEMGGAEGSQADHSRINLCVSSNDDGWLHWIAVCMLWLGRCLVARLQLLPAASADDDAAHLSGRAIAAQLDPTLPSLVPDSIPSVVGGVGPLPSAQLWLSPLSAPRRLPLQNHAPLTSDASTDLS